MTQQERDALVDTPVTLNGKPARIMGRLLEFPSVATIPQGPAYQWSWDAVVRIVAAGGDFRS